MTDPAPVSSPESSSPPRAALVLDAAQCRDPLRVGGKAATLGRVAALGFPVPPFVAIPADVFGADGAPPEGLVPALREALAVAGAAAPFAVRSSGTQEDGALHSHAGQFETLLGVDPDGLGDAVARVAASAFAGPVAEYRRRRGLDGGAIAVVVQTMIAPRAAGVLFTADPVGGRRDRLIVSAVAGLADRLVAGEVDGATYALDGDEPPAADPEGPLRAADLEALRDLGRRLEAALGAPQDVEWAFEGERLLVLQARPITTLPPAPAQPLPDQHRTILDNANIVESYPGLVAPLTYSFATTVYARVYRTFLALVGVSPARIAAAAGALENMLARVDGRVYYNLLNWYRALALLPFFGSNRRSMETMMGVSEPLPDAFVARVAAETRAPSRTREILRAARAIALLAWRALRLRAMIRDFETRLDAALGGGPDPATLPLSQLAGEYRRIEASLLDRWDAPLVNDFLCMAAFGVSRRLMERWAGADGLAIHNDVMIGQGDIVSAEPAQRIRAMADRVRERADPALVATLARGDRAGLASDATLASLVEAYLARFGDRCVEELKLESIPLSDDPAPLLRAVAATAGAPRADPHARDADPWARLDAAFAARPARRKIARALVGYAKARVRDRENLRFERTRIFGRARRVFLRIGEELAARGHLEAPRDVLQLTVQEVLGFVEGAAVTADLKALVRLRAAEAARDAAKPTPPERIEAAAPVRAVAAGAAEPAAADTSALVGTGCSAGAYEGLARVIVDPAGASLAPDRKSVV